MTCDCGYADECDGEHGILYPLQDGGLCSVVPCKAPKPAGLLEQIDACRREVAQWPEWMRASSSAPRWMQGWDDQC